MVAVVSPFVAQDQPNSLRPMDHLIIINSSYVNKITYSIINHFVCLIIEKEILTKDLYRSNKLVIVLH